MSEEQTAERLDIRKYPNRRYYDATRSEHLTLEDIRRRIREGCSIRVTDSRTGMDITAQVLAQIILELDTPKLEAFPVALLTRLIRENDRMVKDFMDQYFSKAFQMWIDYQKQLEDRFKQVHGIHNLFSPLTAWTEAMIGSVSPAAAAVDEQKPASPGSAAGSKPETDELRAVIEHLRKEVSDLKRALKQKKGKRPLKSRSATAQKSS